jgi:hypothetical protein
LAQSDEDFDFTKGSLDKWTTTAGKVNTGADGAVFTINKQGDAPTIQSDFYLFYGSVEVTMKAAPGTGIVSSIVLESDTLDEVDWVSLLDISSPMTQLIRSNIFYRRLLVVTLVLLRPTTSVRAIPRPMTVTLGPVWPTPRVNSTPTRWTGKRITLPGTLTVLLSVL